MNHVRPRRTAAVIHAIVVVILTALCALQATAAQAMTFETLSGPRE